MEDDRIDQINNTIDEMVTILEGIVEENGQYEDAHVMTQKMEALMASLQESLTIQAEQPVVICDGEKLMNAGITLYNASRKAFKIREGEIVLHILVLPRFLAARTMKLALTFESGGNHNTENIQPSYLDQCLDVLRAFGRVGCLMMECAKKELDKSQHFLSLAVECLEGVTRIWSQIGLSYLTHLKCRSELEEVLQEIWDFFITRIKVLGIIEDTQKGTEGNDSVSGILDSLQELRVLVPYLSAYANDLVEVITAHIDALHSQGKYDLESILAEESLRVADTLEIIDQPLDDGILQRFRSHLLLRLLDSVAALGDIERAEACFSLLPPGRESVSLLVMLRLYLRKQLMEKAISCVRKLLQQGDVTHATKGVEAYVQAQNFSEESLKLYDDLQRCFGDNAFEIKLSLAENLAYSNSRKNRQSALSLIQSILEMLHDSLEEASRCYSGRVQKLIFDAMHEASNLGEFEECVCWAEKGLSNSSSNEEAVIFMRFLALATMKLGNVDGALKWSEEAYKIDASKKSLFSLFQASLELTLKNPESTKDTVSDILKQLLSRHDFDVEDLYSFGKAAHDKGIDSVALDILDKLAEIIAGQIHSKKSLDRPKIVSVPFGNILQNAAQLAFQHFTKINPLDQPHLPKGDNADKTIPYADKFLKYGALFLEVGQKMNSENASMIGSIDIFQWFYNMSFMIAKGTERGEIFLLAANIANLSKKFYSKESTLGCGEKQCLTAFVTLQMRKIETLSRSELQELLQQLERLQSEGLGKDDKEDSEAEHAIFLTKSFLAIKLRLLDPNAPAIFTYCMEKMPRDSDEYMHLGELVLHASKFQDADKLRDSYRSLSRNIFKFGLQILLQGENIKASNFFYFLRQLISLSETKQDAYDWLVQYLQLSESLNLNHIDMEVEWLVGKSWNYGVSYFRSKNYGEANKFMKIALEILDADERLKQKMGNSMMDQYQKFMELSKNQVNNDK